MARFDLQRQQFDCTYLLEGAHAQESTALERALEDLEPSDVVMGRTLGSTDEELAGQLRALSGQIDLRYERKHQRGPKKKVVKPPKKRKKTHVSTAKILQEVSAITP